MTDAIEKRTMCKIYLRLLPFAFVAYSLCYMDRINVSFAGLTMRGDLGLSATEFGFAAGSFYWATSSSRCRVISSWKRSARGCGSRGS
jgi:MFS transporter, ACS family, tartrate transporter